MNKNYYNRHYIKIDDRNCIVESWSDGLFPEKDPNGFICINDKGTYQFRLFPDGEENPSLYDQDMIPFYKWDGKKVVPRTEKEIEDDRSAIPPIPPSELEQLRADVDYLLAMGGLV